MLHIGFAVTVLLAGALPTAAEDPRPVETAPAGGRPASVYYAIETSVGNIVLELDLARAPISVANFAEYAASGYYAGTIFHRVIPNFMIQGGGLTPALEPKKEGQRKPIKNEWRNGLKNTKGTVAMARIGGNPDSATSQFFINVVDNAQLDQPQPDGAGYAVFGKVIGGMETVETIRNTPTRDDARLGMGRVVPESPIVIRSVRLLLEDEARAVAARPDAPLPAPDTRAAERAAVLAAIRGAEEEIRLAAEKELLAYLAKVEAEQGKKFVQTPSGLRYMILKEGTGPSPKPTDTVKVHYTGWLLDGTKFDSSLDRGEPTSFPLNRVIAGWTEGVGRMKVGEKCRLVIPADLGYGARGSPPRIPPNATLVFDVELLGIN